ncbi:MAG: hypothetical protein Ct9H300mP20_20950 [Gammaproteobacteria bacterium]|nr:MAG: hypothetical protein Ct9H300mP20_20950 [Gammaproteobacteria bacterium]
MQKEQSGFASPSTNDVLGFQEGGALLDKVEVDRGAFACMLGGKRKYPIISTATTPQKSLLKGKVRKDRGN